MQRVKLLAKKLNFLQFYWGEIFKINIFFILIIYTFEYFLRNKKRTI